MKTALITTTINVPKVLELYRACGPDVAFFVAGDQKTPFFPIDSLGKNAWYLSPEYQKDAGYKCSELIDWNTISRRNIALLEALKWGAEIIVTIDDDNIPLSTDYFDRFEMVFGSPFSGIKIDGPWFDVGNFLGPRSPHRGFPYQHDNSPCAVRHAVNVNVGVAAGICMGDPDISAVTRIANAPIVHNVSELLRAGIVTDPKETWTVFNSQNTAFIRKLAPCFLMVPQFGRYDDIVASLIAQRVMRETGHVVHFGQPFVWQQRNPHDLIKDLKAEMFGMENILTFASFLDELSASVSVINNVRNIYSRMEEEDFIPDGVAELGLAWCEDLERVL